MLSGLVKAGNALISAKTQQWLASDFRSQRSCDHRLLLSQGDFAHIFQPLSDNLRSHLRFVVALYTAPDRLSIQPLMLLLLLCLSLIHI